MRYKIFTKNGIAYGVDDEGNTFHLPVAYLNESLTDGGQLLADNTVKQWTYKNRDRANLPMKNNLWKKEAARASGYSIQTYQNAMCREGKSEFSKPKDTTIIAPKRPSDCTMSAEQWKEYQDYLKWEKEVTDLNKETPFGYQTDMKKRTGSNYRCGEAYYSNTEQDWWMQFYDTVQTGWTSSAPNCSDSSPTYEYKFNQEKWDNYTKGWQQMEKDRYQKLVECRMSPDRVRAEGRHLWCNEGDPDHLKYYPNDCVMLTPRKKVTKQTKQTAYTVPTNNQDWGSGDCGEYSKSMLSSDYNPNTPNPYPQPCGSSDVYKP